MLGKKFNKATYVTSSLSALLVAQCYKGLKVLRTFTKLLDL